jgi:hypothetical protein
MRAKDKDTYVLSSGREFYANRGILGIAPREGELYEGYDGGVYIDEPGEEWTADEKRELADYMIALWSQWKADIK